MKIKIISMLSIITLTFFGCSATHQFIDVDETLLINPGMSKSDIRAALGKPTEVRAGIVLENGKVIEIWRYQVKEMQTKEVIDINKILPAFLVPKSKPNKEFRPNNWKGENAYGLVFRNDKLIKWGYLGDDWIDYDYKEGDELTPSASGGKSGGPGGAKGGLFSKIPIIGSILSKLPVIGSL